ncbi:hypothetical protein C1X05_11495 [Laceyella sacchari]|nr:hypothetical protein C1X05_11495 [Laceyella sacchari]
MAFLDCGECLGARELKDVSGFRRSFNVKCMWESEMGNDGAMDGLVDRHWTFLRKHIVLTRV